MNTQSQEFRPSLPQTQTQIQVQVPQATPNGIIQFQKPKQFTRRISNPTEMSNGIAPVSQQNMSGLPNMPPGGTMPKMNPVPLMYPMPMMVPIGSVPQMGFMPQMGPLPPVGAIPTMSQPNHMMMQPLSPPPNLSHPVFQPRQNQNPTRPEKVSVNRNFVPDPDEWS